MKITNKSKKPATLPTPVAEFVANVLDAPEEQLVYILGSVETWKWPRSDLHAWIKVLNKFDAILEEIINQYELDKVQLVTFPSQTKALVSEILRFHRLLLENSTNRKSFNSYDRLNSLLLCSDLDIVLLSLNVLLRPAQQYSSQSSVSHALNLSTPRLLALARRWPHLREYGINFIDLVSNKKKAEVEGVAVDAREVSYSFYKMDGGITQSMKEEAVPEVLETPSNTVAPSVGPINVYIPEAVLQTQTPMKILADCVRQYRVPDEEKFELLSRIRIAQALYKGHESEREKLVIARLLSIAIYAHTHNESQATSTFFLYEPDLISSVAELLHVEHDVPLTVQTAAIAVLDAFTRYRNRCQEVLTAVNAGVNHGILMALFRKTVNDIASPNSETPQSFVEALIQFVNLIAAHTSGVNMIIGAGLIPLLLQIVENKLSNRLPIVSKTMQLIDSALYAFPNGFTIFCAARGVAVLVDRIQHEVDYGIQEYGQYIPLYEVNPLNNELPVVRTSLLKHLLRTMHRMMQSNGLAEGLRGLIDTSLVKSVKKIIDNRGLFGPTVLPLAINIMATFVHNEPTSLSIIQEAGLPESFYKAIEVGIEPSIEVIQSIPNGLGALCLNETGQAQLNNRPSIIPSLFTIFTSEKHMKVLLDKESAVIIGAAIDELVRHHPLLKAAVFASLKSIMSSLVEIGNRYEVPADLLHWYQLVPSVVVSDHDVKMEDVGQPSSTNKETEMTDAIIDASSEDHPSKAHENIVVSYIDVLCRFLEGFFQHAPHCKDFINLSDGLAYLGKLTALPSLPYDFSNSVASDSLVQVMRTLVDFVTNETLVHLGKIIRDSLQETNEFWQEFDQSSKLLPFLEINGSTNDDHNGRFRSLVTLHIRISLLSDVFGTVGYSHGRGAIALLQTLMESGSGQTIPELGALHRATIWENITLNAALTSRGIPQASSPSPSLDGTPSDLAIEPSTSLNSGQTSANGIESDTVNMTTPENQETKVNQDETPLARNAAALKYITHGVPNVLAPLFQSIVKMLHARRNPEAPQKKQIMGSGAVIADIMIKHLRIPQLEDVSSLYIYYSVVLGLFNLIFVDERTSTNTLHSVALLAFYKKGGFDEIIRVCSSLTDIVKDTTDMREEDRTDKSNKVLIHAYGTIKVALNFVYPIISSKPLFESTQTLLLITRDKKETDPGFFDPNNFLVKLRLKVLPLLRLLWEAPWLVRAPLPVSKAIVRAVLEVANAENEQSKPETATENVAPQPPRPSGPDENRVQMLVDMGFSRAAAEHALTQTRNNVNAATDLLLAHPFAFPVDHEPAEPQDDNNTGDNNNNDIPVLAEGQEQSSEATTEPLAETGDSSVNESSEQGQGQEETKTIEEWRQTLEEARSPLRETISRQALLLIDEHQSLLFELHSIFVRSGAQQSKAIRDLIDDIKSFSSSNETQEQPLANRCRLLALVLTETPSSLDDAFKAELLERLLTLMLSGITPENPPKWLASHLLVTESLLILSDEPRTITLPKEDEPINPEPLSNGLSRPDAKTIVFDFCLRLLAVKDLPSHEYLSVLRLLVYFTKGRQFVKQFVESDGIGHILRRLGASDLTGGSAYIIIILRHVIEDRATVHDIMSQSIKRYFAHPRSNLVDVPTYIRNCNSMAFRDTDIFLEVTKSLCALNFAYAYNPHITLKEEKNDKTKESGEKHNEGKPAGISGDHGMQVEPITGVLSASGEQYAENVVHILISELMATIKTINEPVTKQTSTSGISPVVSSTAEQPSSLDAQQINPENPTASQSDSDNKNQYACFLMQCLTELLFSYDVCKIAFLSYTPKKRNQTPAKESANKLRAATVQFLLNDVINPGTINPSPSEKNRQHLKLCHWAMLIIVSLCVDTSASPQEAKEVSSELVAVRKFVLETVNRSLKDISSIENLEVRYGRLLAYADLCHRLLVIRFNTPSTSNRKQQDEVPTHISKIMLEKNFVATLTTALSEVDLNYPNIRNLVASVLRPLQYLTKIAIKMSRGTKNKEFTDAKKDDSTSSSLSSQEDDDSDDMSEDARQETPDLYRNSALGMYAGEMDDGHYSSSDEMDEDGEDEEDVEMDYGEVTGSEATSEATNDSEEDELEEDEQEEGEEWDEVGEEEEEDIEEQDLIENNNDDDEEDDVVDEEDLEEEADEDGNLLWEDIPPPHESGLGAIGEDMDEEDEHGGVTIPIMRHEEEDADMVSDDEGFRFENGIFSADSVFPFGGPFINITTGQHPPPVFMSRRNRSENDDLQVFGRARNAPPPPETITHPLLLDTSNNSTRLTSNVRRGPRHSARSIAIVPDIFHSIDDIMGPGSTQYIQQLLATAAGGTHAFSLDMGNVMNFDRLHRRPNQGVISAAIRVERGPRGQTTKHGREFDPLLTLQRWAEEVKILNGEFVSDRSGKLVNHVILTLLPAAAEAKKRDNEQKEAEDKATAEKEGEKVDIEVEEPKHEVERILDSEDHVPAADAPESEPSTQTNPVPVDVQPLHIDEPMETASVDQDAPMTDATTTETNEVGDTNTHGGSTEATTSQTQERVTVMIHGSLVDITDTGIDPTFLEALPDDMREEVLNQHVRDQRAAIVERPPDSQISAEFLEALPPEIRAEIIQQEAIERARQRAEDVAAQPAQPTDLEPPTFIANFDPSLRQSALLEQNEGFLQSLPHHILAETDFHNASRRLRVAQRTAPRALGTGNAPRKYAMDHDAIQLLDKPGIAALVRLLFFPQVSKKNLLFKVLVNLCENAKSRTELFNILLGILQDGPGDLSAVDKSFSQLTVRNTKPPTTPKSLGKQKAASEFIGALASPNARIEAVPDLIVQRCLEGLTYIVSANELSSLFFLTEHELPAGLRRHSSKKGKGKEKQIPQSHYPIVLLLGLLDRQSLIRTPAIMEAVVGLLATVTRPLASLKAKDAPQTTSTSTSADKPPSTVPENADYSPQTTVESQQTTIQSVVSANAPPIPSLKEPKASLEALEEKILLANPPQIPHSVLCLIVNILTVGECSGRTFQQSLGLIQHLSYIPDAREVIAQELRSKAEEFGHALYIDLDALATALQGPQEELNAVAAKFSPASSLQAKLLRVLKTIDYMYSSKATSPSTTDVDIDKVQAIYESFRFTPLWRRLGDCLSIIEEKPETEHIAIVLLPLIEALMVVCKYAGTKLSPTTVPRALRGSVSPRSPTTPRESMEDLFISFTDSHRKVLNVMVRNNPSLMSGSFALLVNNPRVLDFDNKRNYFNQQLHRRPQTREHYGTLQLNVRRARVFEDSFQYLQRKSGDQIKYGKMNVRFYDEEGVDAGGVTREWFQILARQMFDPNNALFQPCAADKLTYQPNKNSWVNPEHLSFFKFVGRVIGKAIYDGRLLDAYFAKSLYRQILGKPVDYRDVEWVDPEYYKSLCWILENDPTVLDLNFSVEADEFGVNRIVPLKENGESIIVTNENKREFVQLSAQYRLVSSIKEQIENMLNGFYEIIPKDLVTIFNEQELELLISGTPDIDVDEWRAATEYNGYTSSDPNIVWWWRALKSFNREERAKVLSFATGTSRVPLSGFVDLQGVQGVQRFSIHRAYGEPDRLPQAHTCFNQIDLPQYSSYEMLRQKLLLAINEGGEGFAFS